MHMRPFIRRRYSEEKWKDRFKDKDEDERMELQDTVMNLQRELMKMQRTLHEETPEALEERNALELAQIERRNLERKVKEGEKLYNSLYKWIGLYHPNKFKPDHIEPRLLEEPTARVKNMQWLSERACNIAIDALPPASYHDRLDDFINVRLDLDTDIIGTYVKLNESISQYMVSASFVLAGRAYWRSLQTSSVSHELQVLEKVDNRLMYVVQQLRGAKTRQFYVCGFFESESRIIITQTAIANDEVHPLERGEIRSNGYGWIVLDRITDEFTLIRRTIRHSAPINVHGPIHLRMFSQLYNNAP
ncbi:hypothetical protein Ae201684_013946 [Aphanomyces euteiches]|uniref:START domain-containing protein n=1 Tax=Aphanomyces euteiches TaxID=100861 RepID=A0A6G0WLG1_9STRA|nr:hypothetical protein Ae201684_013946 [Aphanomyces euteiches]KAH9152156.1 hypothetical protein AeRB84_005367 [Aphanomyces euteiches]